MRIGSALRRVVVGAVLIGAVPAAADVVSDWAELQTAAAKAGETPEYMFNPITEQAWAKLCLAMFEAANAVDPRYVSYLKLPPAAAGASIDAAVSTAAHDTLLSLYPDQAKMIDDAYVLALTYLAPGGARDAGIAAGKAAAIAALAAGGIDAALPKAIYMPTAPAGKWAPSQVPYDPRVLQFRPWILTNAAQLRIGKPPALSSARYAASLNEVKARGAKVGSTRTPGDTLLAKFWAFYDFDPVLRQVGSQPGRSVVQNARMYALLALAGDDLGLMMADGKLYYATWRPMNAIRQAAGDGNAATAPDPLWEPLLNTPRQPEYPCGHCSVAATFATIMAAEGPVPAGGLHFTSERMPGISVTVADWPAFVTAVNQSRIDGGVHFRFANEESVGAGAELGKLAMARLATR